MKGGGGGGEHASLGPLRVMLLQLRPQRALQLRPQRARDTQLTKTGA